MCCGRWWFQFGAIIGIPSHQWNYIVEQLSRYQPVALRQLHSQVLAYGAFSPWSKTGFWKINEA
jgi:hypothetical protein